MIQKVRNSGIMETDMKVSIKMASCMAKVKKNDWLILSLFDDFVGKWFWNNGERYEGEWKDDIMHGKGKKEVIYLSFHCLMIL